MSNDLLGLILVGGKSKRMKQDKAQLHYHGENQTQRVFNLLKEFCKDVYVSCRTEQRDESHLNAFSQIHDQYGDVGPLGGILSAQKTHPDQAFLVVACDLPYLTRETLKELISKRDEKKIATCFENPEKKWAEPLCSIYESHSHELLEEYIKNDIRCPRKILSQNDVKRVELSLKDGISPLDNINTPEEYNKAIETIEEGHHAN